MMVSSGRTIARIFIVIGFLIVVGFALTMIVPSAYALPEYANRTHEPCATCHVNPGGGGPRTLRGMLWAAQGRPDQVPIVENTLLAPGVTDPLELYTIACAGCHGRKGEGLFATSLTEYYLTENLIRLMVLRGAPRSGMPSFSGQITDNQLEILVTFVKALSDGDIVPPDTYPLPPPAENCGSPESGVCDPEIDPGSYQGN